ncbi:MAG: peptidase U32 family protein [Cyclobacteriaceae bacterium]
MKSSKDNVMILSPAGSFEALTAAIQAGADAIYFGVEQLNMRARSANYFTIEDMRLIAHQCKQSNVKAYLTLNTVLYDYDMRLMREIISSAKESDIDAVIASDHAAMTYVKSIGMPLHISTQSSVSNIETVDFYSNFADVIVLARELSLKQVAEITREIIRRDIKGPSGNLVKIEVFVHGALCMAISGKCHLSLHSHFASANRGACLQNCRRPYVVIDKEEGMEFEIDNEYIMSAKDLCTIDILDQMIDAGISILKIEGRGRSADYVSVVTRCYKEAVDAIKAKQYNSEKIEQWKSELSKVYNRGFWEGYYLGRHLGEWTDQSGSIASEKKIYVGKGSRYYPKIGIGEFVLETGTIGTGDTLMVIGRTEGVRKEKLNELRVNGIEVIKAKKGDVISLPWPAKISKDDKLYKILEDKNV